MIVHNLIGIALVLVPIGLTQNPATLSVQGISGTSTALTTSDLSKMRQQTIRTVEHGSPVTFLGVPLIELLAMVKTPSGSEFNHTAASCYLVAEGKDGYRVVFSWAEVDPAFTDAAVYVVTQRDGGPLSERDGPFQLVVPGDKKKARWVRQLVRLRVEALPTSSAFDSREVRPTPLASVLFPKTPE